ncbi:V-type ATP synthase subunit A [Nocardioides sp. Soil777]|uniref:V-type ATP synthase subunit A n=1 Tax=Nocardioides sp. Soil777 TaxID=1736409 RepID=UPI000AAC5E01|nr:V-type ATP synthase subunit A [Nocardioides sp. Soil777]
MSTTPTTMPSTTHGGVPAGSGDQVGTVVRVSGPVLEVTGLPACRLYDVVKVGPQALPGEVIRLDGALATVQVFEDTSGLRAGDPVTGTGGPLTIELGPGLLGTVFDGTQRPLAALNAEHGIYIPRGADLPGLDRSRTWEFLPSAVAGDRVEAGDQLGTVQETAALRHRVLVPPGVHGVVEHIAEGSHRVDEVIARVQGHDVQMLQRWPIRRPRPVRGHQALRRPLLTGQRVLDSLFPIALGGAGIIPGGFGTGKTVLEQAIAKHAEADVVVYVGCGERGNELTEVLEEFPQLSDPRTGRPLMERTVLVANTSNMPVAAREASVYLGITMAEYYRDQGLHAVLLADSTSRWGEALREVSGRLGEIPAEDGYPAYLATRLAAFYERAGLVDCLGSTPRSGSVTVVGAVSPAGGDFSEPVTQNSLRVAGCFWALDASLARSRHFPSINWTRSYTTYRLGEWFDEHVAEDWSRLSAWAVRTLQEEGSLLEVVSLLGVEAVAPPQRVTLRVGRMLREDYLQQNSFDPADASCPPAKQVTMLRLINAAEEAMTAALAAGRPVADVVAHPVLRTVATARGWPVDDTLERHLDDAVSTMHAALTTKERTTEERATEERAALTTDEEEQR